MTRTIAQFVVAFLLLSGFASVLQVRLKLARTIHTQLLAVWIEGSWVSLVIFFLWLGGFWS